MKNCFKTLSTWPCHAIIAAVDCPTLNIVLSEQSMLAPIGAHRAACATNFQTGMHTVWHRAQDYIVKPKRCRTAWMLTRSSLRRSDAVPRVAPASIVRIDRPSTASQAAPFLSHSHELSWPVWTSCHTAALCSRRGTRSSRPCISTMLVNCSPVHRGSDPVPKPSSKYEPPSPHGPVARACCSCRSTTSYASCTRVRLLPHWQKWPLCTCMSAPHNGVSAKNVSPSTIHCRTCSATAAPRPVTTVTLMCAGSTGFTSTRASAAAPPASIACPA